MGDVLMDLCIREQDHREMEFIGIPKKKWKPVLTTIALKYGIKLFFEDDLKEAKKESEVPYRNPFK